MRVRTYVVTGAASGIGRATTVALRDAGHRVFGVDRLAADTVDILADLVDETGRRELVAKVGSQLDALDGLVVAAGVSGVRSDPELVTRVNFFGAIATLSGLRPLLDRGSSPRAAVVSSVALLRAEDDRLVEHCLAGDEPAAVVAAHANTHHHYAYAGTKRAVSYWVRRNAVTSAWAGAGILLNAVAPGLIRTPMTEYILDDEKKRAAALRRVLQPLGLGSPEDVAGLLVWLTAAENRFLTGQTMFLDGGHEALAGSGNLPRLEQREYVAPAEG